MGTINYRTSDYITMGIRPYNAETLKNDLDFMQMESEYAGETLDDRIAGYIELCYEDDFYNAMGIIKKYNFHYYDVKIEPGYYHGFSINIEYEHDGWDFETMEDKNNAKMEVSQVRECLKELADIGLRACYPWWCTKYEDYNGTLEAISEACDEMLEDVRKTDVEWFSWEV